MSSTALNTKERIVELGRDFVQRVGYHAFKYQLIAQELNIKNAAIHHYFPNKEDLGVAIVEKDYEDFRNGIKSLQKSNNTEKMEMLLTAYQRFFDEGKNLCVLGACSSACDDLPPRMHTSATEYMNAMMTWQTAVLKEGKANGEFTFSSAPEEIAALWSATLPGALHTSKMMGAAYLTSVMNQLRKTLKE